LLTQAEPGSSGNSQDLTISTRELICEMEVKFHLAPWRRECRQYTHSSVQAVDYSRSAGVSALTVGNGRGGNISIETERLIAQNGGQISAKTQGSGQAGTLTVNARESVELTGTDIEGFPSGLFTQSTGRATDSDAGNADNLTVTTRQLTVRDGAAISADTFAGGKGGSLDSQCLRVY
jgi:large exoprotein involved in heme utilization and adhesion